jgi:hypothetical protein
MVFLPPWTQNSIIITIGNKEVEEGEKRKNGDFLVILFNKAELAALHDVVERIGSFESRRLNHLETRTTRQKGVSSFLFFFFDFLFRYYEVLYSLVILPSLIGHQSSTWKTRWGSSSFSLFSILIENKKRRLIGWARTHTTDFYDMAGGAFQTWQLCVFVCAL